MSSSSSEDFPRPPKRMRHRHSTYNHTSRRRRHKRRSAWHTQNLARLAASVAFVLLVLYEFFVLRGAFSPRQVASITAVRTPFSSTATSQRPYSQSVSAPVINTEKAQKETTEQQSTREKVRTAAHVGVKQEENPVDDFTPPLKKVEEKKETQQKNEEGSQDSISVQREQDAAVLRKLEARAADADEESETSNTQVSSSVEQTRLKDDSSKQQTSQQSSNRDVPSPKLKKRHKHEGSGAQPGAGENFWQWFQETKGSENGQVGSGLGCPADYDRLCKMVFKYFRKYKIRAVFDVGCGKNLDWIEGVLKKIGNELWGFKYYCGEPDTDRMATAKESLSSLGFVEFVTDEWWRVGFPEDTELLFAWDVLPHIAYGRIWNFFVKAKAQDIKYILIDNYPGIMNDPSPKRNYLNVRKHPFRFPAAKEVVQNVTEPGETAKRQLLFYESSMLPDNLQ